ncbi:hypothetical protein [Bradyrhizobium sp.]|uniref:hypothetical protein n=1 Tax=Bradyrhizobium sp. TaxID=376 RepID=UPI003C76DFA4
MPELPAAIVDPARLGVPHDFDQTRTTNHPLRQEDIVVSSTIHGLQDDASFGKWLPVDRPASEVFAAKPGDHICQQVTGQSV